MLKANAVFAGCSVNDINIAKDFYTSKLGLTLKDETMGLNLELPGGGELFLYSKDNHTPASYTYLNLVVDNIDEAVEQLKSDGIAIEHYDDLPGQQDDKGILRGLSAGKGPDIAWLKDPAGNIIAILQTK